MTDVSERDLRNYAGDVLDAVMRGERLTVTRRGKPIAELRPIADAGASAATLVSRWHSIPRIDVGRLRADLGVVVNPTP